MPHPHSPALKPRLLAAQPGSQQKSQAHEKPKLFQNNLQNLADPNPEIQKQKEKKKEKEAS